MTTLGITGASGQLARGVLRHLLDGSLAGTQGGPIAAVTRTPDKLTGSFGSRVDPRRGDFDDEASLVRAFKGIDRLLFIPASDLTPGVRPRQHRSAVNAAVAAGVRHIIYVSSIGARPGAQDGLLETHFVTEQAVINAGLPWTLIRMNIYADSQLDALRRAAASGVHAALSGAPWAYVVRDDLARLAAAVLAAPKYEGITFHATGPVSVTQEQLAEAAGRAAGVPIAFKPLTAPEATAGLTAAGLPPFLVDVLGRFQQAGSEGAFDLVSGDIARLTGRPAQAATDFVAEALRATQQ
jgi:NAD(P)H dehydrogenase (quinone)